jgi:transcriptional regulator with XRE-family HTH domain
MWWLADREKFWCVMTKIKENPMEASKQQRSEANGWKLGDVADFLELTPEESAMVEIRLALSRSLKDRRKRSMIQAALATKIGSSQPRVAMAENGDASVSIELLIRSLLATGITVREIGQIIGSVG